MKTNQTLQTISNLLATATAVSVDGGPVLTHWDRDDIKNQQENQIAHFVWKDEQVKYSCTIDECGVSEGEFAEDGTFSCQDTEGETVTLLFYELKVINPTVIPR